MGTFQLFPPISTEVSLTGDVQVSAGDVATVVGLQTVPISPTIPTDGQILEFVAADDAWVPTTILVVVCISVNGAGVSPDALILVNAAFALEPNDLNVYVNGVLA